MKISFEIHKSQRRDGIGLGIDCSGHFRGNAGKPRRVDQKDFHYYLPIARTHCIIVLALSESKRLYSVKQVARHDWQGGGVILL